jgi:hypothetical protein
VPLRYFHLRLAHLGVHWQHTSAYVSIRQHTHTSAYVSIRHHRLAHLGVHWQLRQHTSAYVSIRQHTSAYAYVSIRQLWRALAASAQESDTYSLRMLTYAYADVC